MKVAAPPLDSHCDGPVTYPGDTKMLVKSSKGRSGPTLNTTTVYCVGFNSSDFWRKGFTNANHISWPTLFS